MWGRTNSRERKGDPVRLAVLSASDSFTVSPFLSVLFDHSTVSRPPDEAIHLGTGDILLRTDSVIHIGKDKFQRIDIQLGPG